MKRIGGFTLVELMITVAILAILLVAGIPSFREWLRNTHIRTAAESIQNGLRYARGEASSRGANVRFEFVSSGAGWTVCELAGKTSCTSAASASADNTLQNFVAAGGSADVAPMVGTSIGATASPLSTAASAGNGITFNALGRPIGYGTVAVSRIDLNTVGKDGRRLVILVSPGGMPRMCDPNLSLATSPQGCK